MNENAFNNVTAGADVNTSTDTYSCSVLEPTCHISFRLQTSSLTLDKELEKLTEVMAKTRMSLRKEHCIFNVEVTIQA